MIRFLESLILAVVEFVLGHPVSRDEAKSGDVHLHMDITFILEGPLDEDDLEHAGQHLVRHVEGYLDEHWRRQG